MGDRVALEVLLKALSCGKSPSSAFRRFFGRSDGIRQRRGSGSCSQLVQKGWIRCNPEDGGGLTHLQSLPPSVV